MSNISYMASDRMGNTLNKNSVMECTRHGIKRPAFICQHLQHGTNLGFHQPEDPIDSEWPFQNAWCDECDKFLLEEGEWNDRSEGFAKLMAVCEGCFEEIKQRNIRGRQANAT
jgi:hypothetical protein